MKFKFDEDYGKLSGEQLEKELKSLKERKEELEYRIMEKTFSDPKIKKREQDALTLQFAPVPQEYTKLGRAIQ